MAEAGDVLQPLNDGVITKDDIKGDLFDLTRGTADGRQSDDEITVFKSVGTSIEDLAGAILAYEAATGAG
jgi:ornithine cyclodeaminase